MSIQMKNGCLVYYGSLIGYQAKDQVEVTVDPQFRREELESWLARRGLVPRWEEGVYERLANEGFHARDSAPELQSCRIWQLKPGTPIQMRFIGLDAMAQKFGGAFAGWAVMALLAFFGYNTAENAVQTPEALDGLKYLMSFIPAAIAALSIVVVFIYPLNKTRMAAINADLKERRENL